MRPHRPVAKRSYTGGLYVLAHVVMRHYGVCHYGRVRVGRILDQEELR